MTVWFVKPHDGIVRGFGSQEAAAKYVESLPLDQPAPKCWSSTKPLSADTVNHPPHYTSHPSGIECIQITRHMNFNLGNAIKYLWRVGGKGAPVEDLKKAVWYINDEIRRLGGEP